ncbi:MAG: hypothetical protein VYE81_09035 [Planctomycetota bacterium]|nr:hypothetical protein [Planctomycetota bacterium]
MFDNFVHPGSSFGEIRHRGQLAEPGAACRGPEFYVVPKVDGNGKELPACQQQARHGESAYLDQFPYARTIVRPAAGGRGYFTGATNIAYDRDGNFRGSYTLKNSAQDSPALCPPPAPVSELRLYLNEEDFDADCPVEEKDGGDLLRSLIERFEAPSPTKRPKAE